MRSYRCEYLSRRRDIVGFVFRLIKSSDLRLIDDHGIGAGKNVRPRPSLSEIRLDNLNVWMHLTEQAYVGCMLVDADKLQIGPRLQTRHEILPDKAGGPRDNYLSQNADFPNFQGG
jgi:hypothetical protein